MGDRLHLKRNLRISRSELRQNNLWFNLHSTLEGHRRPFLRSPIGNGERWHWSPACHLDGYLDRDTLCGYVLASLYSDSSGLQFNSHTTGIFWVLCFKTLSVLMDTHKSVNIKNVMVTITTAQLFTVTTVRHKFLCLNLSLLTIWIKHWILNVTRLMKGFIYVNEPPLGSIIYFGTLSDPIFVVITSLFILQGLLALSFNVSGIFEAIPLITNWRNNRHIDYTLYGTILFGSVLSQSSPS